MPALDNPRWERFAQAIVEGLANGDRKPYSQGRAYIAAGYEAKDAGKRGGSAEAAASRLLNRVKPILDRVRELQAEQAAELKAKNRYTIEAISDRMVLASKIAEEERQASAITGAEKAIAELRGLVVQRTETGKPGDFSQCTSVNDIGRQLLQEIGHTAPSDADIAAAIAAHDAFQEQLEAIRDKAQGLGAGEFEH